MALPDKFVQDLQLAFAEDTSAISFLEGDLEVYSDDWTKSKKFNAKILLRPRSTAFVSKALMLCSQHRVSVVPSGGRTGLSGGASVVSDNCLVLSLERMNKVLEIDQVALVATVEAGVVLEHFQNSLSEKELFFGVDLAAKGSCQIGGNIATNAGGTKFIRYGGMREQVVGLEVVMATGEILQLQNGLRKNNIGPDLLQLFIGSEGTLGVITQAMLKVTRKPKEYTVALLSFPNLENLMGAFSLFRSKVESLSAFEYISPEALSIVYSQHPSLSRVIENESAAYALVEVECVGESMETFTAVLEDLLTSESATDGIISASGAEFAQIWAVRERISESISSLGHVYKNDVSVPISKIPEFVKRVSSLSTDKPEWLNFVMFGHIGDGNIHLNYSALSSILSKKQFLDTCHVLEKSVLAILRDLSGSISAEHGLGHLKLEQAKEFIPSPQLSLQEGIKRVFDPQGILNPGKVYPRL